MLLRRRITRLSGFNVARGLDGMVPAGDSWREKEKVKSRTLQRNAAEDVIGVSHLQLKHGKYLISQR